VDDEIYQWLGADEGGDLSAKIPKTTNTSVSLSTTEFSMELGPSGSVRLDVAFITIFEGVSTLP